MRMEVRRRRALPISVTPIVTRAAVSVKSLWRTSPKIGRYSPPRPAQPPLTATERRYGAGTSLATGRSASYLLLRARRRFTGWAAVGVWEIGEAATDAERRLQGAASA